MLQVLNLVPWGGVQLRLPELRLSGVQGWGGLAAAAGQAYLQDIAANQVTCAPATNELKGIVGCLQQYAGVDAWPQCRHSVPGITIPTGRRHRP